MATENKRYLDLLGLQELVDQIQAADAKVEKSAKDYADGLAKNYDASGSAKTAEDNAKAYADEKVGALADGQVKTNKEAIEVLNGADTVTGSVAKAVKDAKEALQANIDAVDDKADANAAAIATINDGTNGILATAKGYTDTEVAKVQGEVDALDGYVGTFTHDTAKSVVEYIDAKTAGIASDAALTELSGRVTDAEAAIDEIEKDYLTSATKTELEGKINVKADQTALDAVSAVANAAVKQSDYNTKVAALEAEDARIVDLVEAEASRADGVEKGFETRIKAIEDDYLKEEDYNNLQTQINTIMNNPDAEGAINSINEFTQYVTEHGTIADGFRTDIDKNKEDIAANTKAIGDLASASDGKYATKTELANEKSALQAEIDADVKVVADDLAELAEVVGTKATQTALNEAVVALEGADSGLDTRLQVLEGKFGGAEGSVEDMIADAKQAAIDAAIAQFKAVVEKALK